MSICIPTYNRAEKLYHCLETIIAQIKHHNIPVYISDNSSSDNTCDVVKAFQKRYEHIFYSCNDENMGADYNIAQVLKMSNTSYSWLMSDDDLIMENGIDIVLGALGNSDFDMVIVNSIQGYMDENNAPIRVKSQLRNLYTDKNEVLIDLGWHVTWISCLIFSKDVAKNGQFDRYRGTNFVHFGAIFDYLAQNDFKVCWIPQPLVCCAENAVPSYSEDRLYEFFLKSWHDIVMSLPAVYSEVAKRKCIKNHAKNIKLFTARWFLTARVKGNLDLGLAMKYRHYFKCAASTSFFIILALCFTPRSICGLIEPIYSKMYQKVKSNLPM